jgi:methyl-accepting chemotaxis protein
MKDISFKYKLIISMLAISIIPLVATSIYNLINSRTALKNEAIDKLITTREAKNETISRYLNTISSQVLTLANDKMIVEAARDFSSSFKKIPSPTGDAEEKLKEYYTKTFAEEYKKKTGETSPLNNIVSELSPKSIMIQHAFISDNANPLGSKHLLDETPLLPEYSNFHKVYHPIIRDYLETFSYYDIFIVDIESGDIVYSVFKELDFSTNLYNGPYKDTNLAEAVKQAKEITNPKEFKIVDFKRYAPSFESPASFIATPIWENGKKIGVLAFQMPLATINEIMDNRAGLGETGETYLVGSDKRLRSDIHNDKEFNIFNSFNKNKFIPSQSTEIALSGKSDAGITQNYNGIEVLSAYNKIKFPHLNWVIFAEQTTKESFAPSKDLLIKIIIFILVSIIIVIIASLLVSKNLSNQIAVIVEAFSKSAHDVQNSSQKMDLISNKLHKSVQTQISSITESAAAMDEISAMLKNNTASSKNAASLSLHSKSSAITGKETVDKLKSEVEEISKSYDEIQYSVDKNNEDINRIVQVISEIANKTKVINDIVFQTKLLSFNASVEAARAGESGKGFAVVAEEIANLAAMSGTAANDISQMLTSSQDQVREIAEATKRNIGSIVKNGRDKVTNGKEVSNQCMLQLDNILSSVNDLDSSIQEITFAIQEQSSGVEEVNSAMKYLENATHETTDMSERSKAASEELHNQSHSLRSSIQELRKILGVQKKSKTALS